MSLINDAIKKANKANKKKAAQSAGSGGIDNVQGMKAAGRRSASPSGGMTGMFIVAGVVVFVLLGGFLLVLGLKNRTATPPQSNEDIQAVVVPDETRPVQSPATPPAAGSTSDPTTNPVVVHTSIDDVMKQANPLLGEPVPELVAEPVVPEEPPGPPEFPALKLQGIFYRLNDPSVIINGKTLWLEESVDDVKVILIDRSSVTVEFDGRTKVLRIE